MKKRILSILLTVCMVLSLLPWVTITAMAAYSPTIYMTLDGQPMSPSSIDAVFTNLTAYNPITNKVFIFTEGPVGTYTKLDATDGTYNLWLSNGTGDSGINEILRTHFLVDQSPFTISNTTSYPLTLEFYSVSYKPGTYATNTGVGRTFIAAKDRGHKIWNLNPLNPYLRDGYKQIGWSTDPSGTTKTYDLGAVIYPTSAMTLYPAWGALRAVTITDGAGVSSTKTSCIGSVTGSITSGTSAVEGETVTITPGTPAVGYKLSVVKYNDGTDHVLTESGGKYSFIMPAAAVTISSEYVSNTFAVTYNSGTNGTGSQQTATKTGGIALTLKNAIFTREGYEQTGWAITDGGTKAYELGASYTTDAPKDFYPVWTANAYNISYILNGGTVPMANPASYTIESASITLNNPTRSDCSFLGWTGSNGTTAQTDVLIPKGSTGDKTYTANWKADKPASAPDASIVTAKTDKSLTIRTQDGYEYSVNGTNWYSGTGSYTFAGLEPNKPYNLVCRKAAVTTGNTSEASDASAALPVTTKNAAPVAPPLTFDSITANNVTISVVTGGEYSKDGGETWQDSNLLTDLSAAAKYNFAVRIKETNTTVASAVSAIVAQYTAAATPGAGVGYTVNYSTETISITSGYEVSSDSSFASDKLLSNGAAITPGTTYYVRKAVDTATTPNTPASAFASFTVAARPAEPSGSAYSYDYHNEQIIFASQYEVFTASSGGIAVTSDSTAITPGGILYIRVKSTASAPVSGWTTITIPGRPATTGLSISTSKTDTTITVAAIAGAEYSKDGGTTWQSSNAFTGLNPNTDYAINIRYAVAASNFASAPLGSVTIKTKTAPGTAPSVPSVSTQTYNSLTVQAIAGCQYAITTSDIAPTTWGAAETETGAKIFSSLSAATQYYIWVRVAETGTAAPSSSSRISAYTAAATPAASAVSINYAAETINFANIYEVSASAGFSPTIASGSVITPGTTYYVRVAANGGVPASAAVSLTLPSRPLMPAATAAGETVAGKNDGRISGVTAAMEWKSTSGTYTAVTADQATNGISGLQDGTYSVRYKAVSGTGFKSDEQEITIAAGHTITVTFNAQSGSAVDTITGKAYGDKITAPADPVRGGFYFAGWYKEAACTNPWTFTLDTLTDDITLYAKWSAIPTYTVTGAIVDDSTPHAIAVEGATVRMMQGATRFGTTGITDIHGDFEIDNVPPGTYNLVITKDDKKAIVKVEVSGDVAIGNAALPSGNANSILVVNGIGTPNVVVGGLNNEANEQLKDSSDPHSDKVDITLTVVKKDASTAVNGSEVTGTVTAAGKQVGMILAIDVNKKVNDTEDPSYNQTKELIEINIPLPVEMQGKATYAIYRYHGAAVDTITETPNVDQERIVVDRANWRIVLYAKKFSTYAIGYTNPAPPRGGSGGGGGGAATTPAADIESQKPVALPYYVENGKEVFVGLAKDASGTMKYIAPEGVTVLFRENPKSFNDIAGHWAKDNIDYVTERELFLGTGDGNFSPQSGMTRAMFATVIGRLYERSYGKLLQKDDCKFTDVGNDAYYKAYINWASENNIITGIGGGLFKPDREITRQEMAAILYRFAEFLSVSPSGLEKTQLNYPDAAGISSWAEEAAGYCQQTGIITGRLGGNFVPQGTATRAEVAAILQRFIESSVK